MNERDAGWAWDWDWDWDWDWEWGLGMGIENKWMDELDKGDSIP